MKPIYVAIGFLIAISGLFFVKNETLGTPIPIPKVIPDNKVIYVPKPAPEEILPVITEVIPEIIEQIFPLPSAVMYAVPFVAQAPFGNWADAEQNYGCEEASLLMGVYWARGDVLTPEIALREIKAMSKFEKDKYDALHDTPFKDTFDVPKSYSRHEDAYLQYDIEAEDIKRALADGSVVVIPIDGTSVNNIYYTPPGPFRHQIIVIGYDDSTQEFITHDPGTMHGGNYRYGYKTIEDSLMDYPTGFNEPVNEVRSGMIVIKR